MAVNPHNKNSVQLIEDLLKEYNIELRKGKNLLPSSGNNWGFPLSNMSTKQAIEWLANRTGIAS